MPDDRDRDPDSRATRLVKWLVRGWRRLDARFNRPAPEGRARLWTLLLPAGVDAEQIRFWEQALKQVAVSKDWMALVEKSGNKPIFKGYVDSHRYLQAEWKDIKAVPAENATELWKNYQHYTEQFYDQLRLNHEMRAYDFKKNLEIKTHLCEAAEKLADVEDVISAFHQLQKLHQEYRETGPVAKELRDEIWKRFKDASTVINKRHQDHFEAIKAKEEENLVKKTELCHTLNGSALALPRIVAALLENNQTPEGIRIPKALVPYCGFDMID